MTKCIYFVVSACQFKRLCSSVEPDQTAYQGAVQSGSTLFDCMSKLVLVLSINMQQTTLVDDIFRCIFLFLAGEGLRLLFLLNISPFKNSVDPDQIAPEELADLISHCVHRGANMSAHVLLNLSNQLVKRYCFFATSLINSIIQ